MRPRFAFVLLPLCALALGGTAALVTIGQHAHRLVTEGGAEFDRIEVRLNEFTSSRQGHVALDMDDAGQVIAVWDSRRQQSGTSGVYARWIDRDGSARGAEECVNLEFRSQQVRPAVAAGPDGAAWFTWTSLGQDGNGAAIVGRAGGDEILVNEATGGDQTDAAATRLRGGRVVTVWTTPGEGPGTSRVSARLSSGDGQPVTGEYHVTVAGDRVDRLPTVAAAGEGFVVAWARATVHGEIEGIFARRFAADGRPAGEGFRVSDPGADAIEPSVAGDAGGRFAIAWMRLDHDTDYDVMLRRYGTDGTALGPQSVASSERSGWQSGAAVAMAVDGRLGVAWTTLEDGGLEADVFARIFDADGNPLSGDLRVNGHSDGVQRLSGATGARRLALGSDGRLAIAWEGDSGDGDEDAANVTILVPTGRNLTGDLASGLRAGRRWLASLAPASGKPRGAAAMPHVPPTFHDQLVDEAPMDPEVEVRSGDVSFRGFASTGWVPPDPHMAAGPSHVLLIVNGGIAAKQKDGTLDWQDEIEGSNGFWGSVGAGGFVFDPEVLYDVFEDRYLAMANERSGSQSYFLLAISSTTDPNDPWYKYRFNVSPLAGDDIDSPNFAVDTEAIYLTADFFGPDRYLVYIVDKSSVLNGGTAVTTGYVHTGTQSFGIPSMYTADAPRMYMIEAYEGDAETKIRLWAIHDPLTAPSLESTELTVPVYYRPSRTRSKGTSTEVITFEARFWSCMYRDGSLWACHHLSERGGASRGCAARWYEIAMNGWPVSGAPSIVQSQTVDPGGNVYLSFNSVFADADGNAVMSFARSSVDEYYSISRTYRRSFDPPGIMYGPDILRESTVAYTSDRWGDYSAVVADPFEPGVFWTHHEFAVSTTWRTRVISENLAKLPTSAPPVGADVKASLSISPTPTSGPVHISFALPLAGATHLEIFDVTGRLVRRLDLGQLAPDSHRITWESRDLSGSLVADGVYLTRVVSAGQVVGTGRIVITR